MLFLSKPHWYCIINDLAYCGDRGIVFNHDLILSRTRCNKQYILLVVTVNIAETIQEYDLNDIATAQSRDYNALLTVSCMHCVSAVKRIAWLPFWLTIYHGLMVMATVER